MTATVRRAAWSCNVYVVDSPDGRLLVDAGSVLDTARLARLLRTLRPDAALLTHHHPDHQGALAAHDVPIHAHPDEFDALRGVHPPARTGAQRAVRTLGRLGPPLDPARVHPVTHGQLLLGHTVIALPGHTRGQVGLHVAGGEHVLCADAVLGRGGRAQLPHAALCEDRVATARSLTRLADLDARVYWPGHGDPLDPGALRRRARRGI